MLNATALDGSAFILNLFLAYSKSRGAVMIHNSQKLRDIGKSWSIIISAYPWAALETLYTTKSIKTP